MEVLLSRRSLRTAIILLISLLAFTVLGFMQHANAETGSENASRHLVTIYDRGEEHTIITRATTVREALSQAHISTDNTDIVEPSLSEKMLAEHYNINVYRARPVVIQDGEKRMRTTTAAQSPSKIAEAAHMTLYAEDTTTLKRVDDVIEEGGAGLKLSVDRAVPFTFVLYGKQLPETRTQATTVGEMLKQKNIKLGKEDGTSVPLNTPMTPGMSVSVWRNGVQTVTQEEGIPAPVQQVQDQDRDLGYRTIQTPGTPGKKQVTYEINMQNGLEVSRRVIQEVQTLAPVQQVEVIGVKVVLPSGSHEDWMSAAGIAPGDYGYVNYIVGREGGWEPCKVQGGAINCAYSGSMGYGIVQATPGGKMASAGGDWRTNPITQLKWATGYATGRYGSWKGAYDHWLSSHNW